MESPLATGLPTPSMRHFLAPRPVKAVAPWLLNPTLGHQVDGLKQDQSVDDRECLSSSPRRSSLPSPAPSDEIILDWPPRAPAFIPSDMRTSGTRSACASPKPHLDHATSALCSPPPSPSRAKPRAGKKTFMKDETISTNVLTSKDVHHNTISAQPRPPHKQGGQLIRPTMTPPPFSGSPELDKFVVSSAAQYTSSFAGNDLNEVVDQIEEVIRSLLGVLRDVRRYKRFLDFRGSNAQRLLDCIQMLLDNPLLEDRVRGVLLIALIRLSRKSDLHPECFDLTNVAHEGDYPVADGRYCEIYKGRLRGEVVCLKIVKMYTASDRGQFRKIAGVAAGMSYLHKNHVVHGDIKGANILVTDSGRACLTDFGLSSLAEAHDVQHPAFSSSGTARFQAPELIDPNFENPRSKPSDVYAFAMTCYQIFTGRLPFFELKRDYSVLLKVIDGKRPDRPTETLCQDRGLTDLMWRLIQDSWEQLPNKRPNAAQISERLGKNVVEYPHKLEAWGDLAPPRLRTSWEFPPSFIEETLRILGTTGIFVSQASS
ncbi:hypothetical protein DXG01_001971 [Tephrocybe rancida]|nr:hypothetical protein DXG01_001971 [Tephrocybe rancida]